MIRDTVADDVPLLVAMAESTGVFKPFEIETLQCVFDCYFATEHEADHRCVTYCDSAGPVGFAYYAPAPMTDRAWELWWIVVARSLHDQGIGGQLLGYAETDIRSRNGRLLLIETSALPHYALTRRFYLKHGYDEEARIRDFYSDGDDLVVFRKRL